MDRQLLEMGRALRQRLLKLERDVRFLRRRVRFPGAMQSVDVADLIDFPLPSSTVVASINLDPGRWLVITEAMLWMTSGFNGTEGITVFQEIVDADSDHVAITNSMTNKRTYTLNGTGTYQSIPVSFVRAYSFSVERRVQMQVNGLRQGAATTGDVINMTFQVLPF